MTNGDLQAWVGRSEEKDDIAAPGPLRRLAALLDHDDPPWEPDAVPPLGHWLFFLPEARQSTIGVDGHPRLGGFMPPLDLPRRMWAGGRIALHAPIRLGAAMKRRSTIASIARKTGSSGELVFVTVKHEIVADGVPAITEEQDIVYRAAAGPSAVSSKPRAEEPRPEPDWQRSASPGPVELFRYSALTFNGHRIHYDRGYAREQEGYPGLVVHGPYIATLLMDLFLRRHPAAPVAGFSYRAKSPLFDVAPFDLCAKHEEEGARLWAQTEGGPIAMEAEITLRTREPD